MVLPTIRDWVAFLATTQWHKAAAFAFIALMGVGLGVGLSISETNARRAADEDHSRRLKIFSEWQTEVTSKFTKAGSIAGSIAAFGMVNASAPANLSAPAASRMSFVNEEGFLRLAKALEREVPGVTSLVLAPGGVASQFYPDGSVPYGLSLYDSPTYRPMFNKIIASGEPLLTGPTRLTTREGYAMHVWHPIFVSGDPPSVDNFWGVGVAMFEVKDLMRGMNVSRLRTELGLDYVMWFVEPDGTEVTMISSPQADLALVKREGMRMRLPVGEGKPSYLAMHPADGPVARTIAPSDTAAVVVATVFGAAFIVAMLYGALLCLFGATATHRVAAMRPSRLPHSRKRVRRLQPSRVLRISWPP